MAPRNCAYLSVTYHVNVSLILNTPVCSFLVVFSLNHNLSQKFLSLQIKILSIHVMFRGSESARKDMFASD